MSQVLRNKLYYLIALLYALISPNAGASQVGNTLCEKEDFKSTYYYIEVEAISDVSDFFKKIPANYFNRNDELFVINNGQRNRVETYFDDNNLSILKHGRELLIAVDKNLPNYRVGKEQIIFKDNSVNPNYASVFEVKNYNKKATPLDKHALFGRVKRKERKLLVKNVKPLIITPIEEIAVKIKVEHQEIVQLYRHFGLSYGAITLNKLHISNYGLPNTYSMLRFELYSDQVAQLHEQERKYLNKAFCNANSDFNERFPLIARSLRPGYASYHKLAERQFPSRALFKKYPLLFEIGQIVVLIFIGFLLLYLVLGRYTKRQNYKSLTKKGYKDNNEG